MRKVVLFDIDYTLFNARTYRERFSRDIATFLNVSEQEFLPIADEVYKELRKENIIFDPKIFAAKLSERLSVSIDIQKLISIISNEVLLENSLYEEAEEVVRKLSSYKDVVLGIFSAGLFTMQRPKIKHLDRFFHEEHIHIYEFRKNHALPELMKQYQGYKVFLIDDILEVLSEAKKAQPSLHTVWILRKSQDGDHIDNFRPDSIIRGLREVLPIVFREE